MTSLCTTSSLVVDTVPAWSLHFACFSVTKTRIFKGNNNTAWICHCWKNGRYFYKVHLATLLRGTVVSLPDGNRTCVYCGIACTSSTSFTTGSYFEQRPWRLYILDSRIWRTRSTQPSRTEIPNVERRVKGSCGVSLVPLQSNERTL